LEWAGRNVVDKGESKKAAEASSYLSLLMADKSREAARAALLASTLGGLDSHG
jgi:hypothetical protein